MVSSSADQAPAVDHRRAIADRNRAAILDASERLLAQHRPLNMAAVAAEAGVSRPTLYAHFKTLGDVLRAGVGRAVETSRAAMEAAEPSAGAADQAIERMLETSWTTLASFESVVRGAVEYLPVEYLHSSHAPLYSMTMEVIERGQREGLFRTDLHPQWLVTAYYALIHAADELARTHEAQREQVLEMLKATVRDLLRKQ